MATVIDDDRKKRLREIEIRIQDPRSIINVDCLIDAVQNIMSDCDHPAIRKIKNIDAFVSRCKLTRKITLKTNMNLPNFFLTDGNVCDGLNALRMRATDFNLIKVIGRGAFGEVQLVRHRSTKKVYAMKLLSKYEMVRP